MIEARVECGVEQMFGILLLVNTRPSHSHVTVEHQGAELVPTIFLITSTPASAPLNFVVEWLLVPIGWSFAPQRSYFRTMVLPTKTGHHLTTELDMLRWATQPLFYSLTSYHHASQAPIY